MNNIFSSWKEIRENPILQMEKATQTTLAIQSYIKSL